MTRFNEAVDTDIDKPAGSMNGLLLAAAVRDRWPPIRIITTSGRVEVRQGDPPVGSLFLWKPITTSAATRRVAFISELSH